jgi:hypothetical protein
MKRFFLGALVLLLAGCGGVDPREPMPGNSGLRSTRPVRIAVTDDHQPTDPTRLPPGRFSPAIDAASVARRANDLLRERGTVADVSSAAEALTLDSAIAHAQVRYEGQTGIFGVKVGITIFFFPLDVPNYFIDSDRFVLTLRAKWRLLDRGQVVAEGDAVGKEAGVFGDFSRGWYLFGYLRMPSPLKADEWQEIADTLVPGAQDALAESLVLETEKALAARQGR